MSACAGEAFSQTVATSSQVAYVRCAPEDIALSVTLTYDGKQRNLNRQTAEPLEKALGRLRASLTPAPKGRKQKAQAPPEVAAAAVEPLAIALYSDEAATLDIGVATVCGAAWTAAKRLRIGDILYSVVVNPPTVEKVALLRRAMVGFPLLALPTLMWSDAAASQFCWSRGLPGGQEWELVGCSAALYVPCERDVGCRLRVECTPGAWAPSSSGSAGGAGVAPGRPQASSSGNGNGTGAAGAGGGTDAREDERPCTRGPAVSAETDPVAAAPASTSAEVRCGAAGFLAPPTDGAWRVVSYNILADQYAGSTYAQDVLFNYCPKPQLAPDYRKQLVLREVLAYRADVLCLQEVDERTYSEYLRPHLRLAGYEGHYTNKMGGRVKEGSAMFWNLAKFKLVATRDVLLRDLFKVPLAPAHARFAPLLASSKELGLALQNVTTIAQAVLLAPAADAAGAGASAAGAPIVICNTHLFFHPYAPHIRNIHVAAILAEAAALMATFSSSSSSSTTPPPAPHAAGGSSAGGGGDAEASGARPAVLFVGDLNSDLNDGIPGVVELLQSGRLPASYYDWQQGAAFRWGMTLNAATALRFGWPLPPHLHPGTLRPGHA